MKNFVRSEPLPNSLASPRVDAHWQMIPVSLQAWCVWDDNELTGPYQVLAYAACFFGYESDANHVRNLYRSKTDTLIPLETIKPHPAIDNAMDNESLDFVRDYWLIAFPESGDGGTRWTEDNRVFFTKEAAEDAVKERTGDRQS